MANVKINTKPTASDCAYVYAENQSGELVRVPKSKFAGSSSDSGSSSGSAGGDTGGGDTGGETTQYRIAITADGDSDYCYITINGTKYYTVQYITVDSGTTIDLYASGLYSGSTITVDGSTVATGKPATHSIKATSGMVIELDAASTMRTYINVTMS